MRKQIKAVAYLLLGTILLTGCGGFSAGSDFTAVSGGSVSGGSVSDTVRKGLETYIFP